MSEQRGGIEILIIVLLLLVIIGIISANTDYKQQEQIRDLQHRIAVLEQERR